MPDRKANADTTKALALAALIDGQSVREAARIAGTNKQRVHEWLKDDPEFSRLLREAKDEIRERLISSAVEVAVERARELAPTAIEAIERGLAINARPQAFKVKGTRVIEGEDGEPQTVLDEIIQIVDVPDQAVAAQIAIRFLRYLQEFNPRQEVSVTGTVEHRMVEYRERTGQSAPAD